MIGHSPAASDAGASTVNFTVASSSSRRKFTGADAGVTVQPDGAISATVAAVGPFWLLATVTLRVFCLTAGATGASPPATGKIAIPGSTLTLNAGETFSSARFSPATRFE